MYSHLTSTSRRCFPFYRDTPEVLSSGHEMCYRLYGKNSKTTVTTAMCSFQETAENIKANVKNTRKLLVSF